MKLRGERSVQDLYDRMPAVSEAEMKACRDGVVASPANRDSLGESLQEEQEIACSGKKNISGGHHSRSESGTCNVCSAPCSSCLHRSLKRTEPNVECESSNYSCVKAENDAYSVSGTKRKLSPEEKDNDDQLSATSSHASYSEIVKSKAASKIKSAADSSEVSRPLKDLSRLTQGNYQNPKSSVGLKLPITRLSISDSNNRDLLEKHKEHHEERNSENVSSMTRTSMGCKLLSGDPCNGNEVARSLKRESCISKNKQTSLSASNEGNLKRSKPDSNSICNAVHDHDIPVEPPQPQHKRLRKAYSFSDDHKGPYRKENADHAGTDVKRSSESTRTVCDNKDCQILHEESVCNGIDCRNGEVAGSEVKKSYLSTTLANDFFMEDSGIMDNNQPVEPNQRIPLNGNSRGDPDMQHEIPTKVGVPDFEYGSLIDVNVCDICGDVGREDLLATCSRCSEGAEHIYCMREKLEKVPEGNWLCEECLPLESESVHRVQGTDNKGVLQKVENTKPIHLQKLVTSREVLSNFKDQDPCSPLQHKKFLEHKKRSCLQKISASTKEDCLSKDLNHESLATFKKLEVGVSDGQARLIERMGNKRPIHLQEACSTPRQECSYGNNQNLKKDSKWKKLEVKIPNFSGQQVKGLLSPQKSVKRLAENGSSPASRGVSENIKADEIFSSKKKTVNCRDISLTITESPSKSSAARAMQGGGKSAKGFERLSRSFSGNLLKSQHRSSSPGGSFSRQIPYESATTVPKVKQLMEYVPPTKKRLLRHPSLINNREKSSFSRMIRSSSFKGTGIVLQDTRAAKPMHHINVSQVEEGQSKENNISESIRAHAVKRPTIAVASSKKASTETSDRRTISHKKLASATHHDKIAGEEMHTCEIRKSLGALERKNVSTVDASDMRISRSSGNANESSSGAADIEDKKVNEEPIQNKCEEVPESSEMAAVLEVLDVPSRATSSEILCRNGAQVEQDPLDYEHARSCKYEETVNNQENQCAEQCSGSELQAISEQFHGTPLIFAVIPEQNFIWRGALEVARDVNDVEVYDGIQAHLSTCVSPKVLEVVNQFPLRVQLQELPRISSWPSMFDKESPSEDNIALSEDNIALFFFAGDIESYNNSYKKLLDSMLAKDLALKGNISGVDFLVYTSNQLPEKSQRWNNLLFLWGVFCSRKSEPSSDPPAAKINECIDVSTSTSASQDTPSCNDRPSLVIDLNENPDELFDGDPSPELNEEYISTLPAQNPDNGCETGNGVEGSMKDAGQETEAKRLLETGSLTSFNDSSGTSDQDAAEDVKQCFHAFAQSTSNDFGKGIDASPYLIHSTSEYAKTSSDVIPGQNNHIQGNIKPTTMDQKSLSTISNALPGFPIVREHHVLTDYFSQTSMYPSEKLDQLGAFNPTAVCSSFDFQADLAKRKLWGVPHAPKDARNQGVGILSSGGLPTPTSESSWCRHQYHQGVRLDSIGSSKNSMVKNSVHPGFVPKTPDTEVIEVLSSDDEAPQEQSNLLFGVPIRDVNFGQNMPPRRFPRQITSSVGTFRDPARENYENAGSSLSLSLSLPGADKGKQQLAEEVHLQLGSCVDTSLSF